MSVMTGNEIQKTYSEALKLHNAGNLAAALPIYGRIIENNPKIAEAHFQVGRIFTATDRFDRALIHLRTAAELRPKEGAIWYAWAEAVALGGDKVAETEFLHMLKAAPTEISVKLALQDRFGARRTSTRPATGGVAPADLRRLVGMVDKGHHAEVERLANTLLAKHPGSAIVMNILATAQALAGKTARAEASFRKAIQLDPKYAEAHDNLGRFLVEQNREDEGLPHFRRAVTLAPGMPSALVNLATSMLSKNKLGIALTLLKRAEESGANGLAVQIAKGNTNSRLRNYERAEEAFLKAVELTKGKHPESIALLAQAQMRIGGKDAEAMRNYDRALSMDPNSPVAVGGKASLLQLLGNFDDAEEYFRKGFEIDPMNGENYRSFITSHKTEPNDPILGKMLEIYKDPRLSDTNRMNLGFAIAKALEDVRDFDNVFKYLSEANNLMRKAYPYDIEQRFKSVELTKAAFDGFDWMGASAEGKSDFAPIFVTGMPRSGTTLIEQIISSHSTVTGAGEVGACSRSAQMLLADGKGTRPMASIPAEEINALGLNFEAYIKERFPEAEKITDKSIQSYQYLGLMKLALPNSRFVVVRRDPRDNLLSIYKNKFPDETHLYAYDQLDLVKYFGTFVDMIDFWRARVPDWFYEVQYEDLVANPEEETRKLIAACGLEWEDACLSFHENKRKVETLSVYQVRQPISKGSVKAWQRYEKELKPMLDALREGGHVSD